MRIQDYIKENRLVLDGAMGTYYAQKKGNGDSTSEYALLNDSNEIKNIHMEYLNAGATLLKTNTFMLQPDILHKSWEECSLLIHKACQILREAITESGQPAFLAGDIGPIPETADTSEEKIKEHYLRMINIFLEEKTDAILFETFSDDRYLFELADYIKKQNPNVFIITSFCMNKNGYTTTGFSAKKLLHNAAMCPSVDACGFNCGIGSGHMYQMLSNLSQPFHKYLCVAPNAGYPEQMQNRMVFMNNVDYFADNVKKMLGLGAAIVGSCCGTSPRFTSKISKVAKEYLPVCQPEVLGKELTGEKTPTLNQTKNSFLNKLMAGEKVVAVELDPPYDADDSKIVECAKTLADHAVDLVTLADSPRGRSRIDSILMSIKLNRVTGVDVMPHVCCRDRNMVAMRSALLGAYVNDIRNLLLVTGDPLPVENRARMSSVFDYNSIRLMEFVQEMNEEHFVEDPFIYGGALNYNGVNVDKIVERMERKMAAGASYFLTQPVYSDHDRERIALLRQRTHAKILLGIMPFVSFNNANFVKNEFAGIEVPEEIVARYHKEMSREEAQEVGCCLASELVEKSKDLCDGYYFMLPFNRVSMMDQITIYR